MREVGARVVFTEKGVEVAVLVCLSGALMGGQRSARWRLDAPDHVLAKRAELVAAGSSLPREFGQGLEVRCEEASKSRNGVPRWQLGARTFPASFLVGHSVPVGLSAFPFLILAHHAAGHGCM